jgi:ubiquinone/menaquinone biosynthesis C-methylase UbiE
MPFDHFDFLAPLYDRVIHHFSAIETMAELGDLPTSGLLLDVGGGTGRVADSLRGQAEKIVIADLSQEMLRQAADKGGFELACSHSEKLPFPDDAFERIVMVDALHHVCNQAETAVELMRVLAPGGRIVIQEPDIHTFAVKLIALGEKLALMRSHFLSGDEIKRLFSGDSVNVEIVYEEYNAWVIISKLN